MRRTLVCLIAHAKLQVRPEAAVEAIRAIDLGPLLFILHVDVLRAEDPAKHDRRPARERRRVVVVVESEARRVAHAMQCVSDLGPRARLRLRHVLCRRLAVTFRRADLPREIERVGGAPVGFERDEVGRGALIRTIDLVIHAIQRARRRRRHRREARGNERVIANDVARQRRLGRKRRGRSPGRFPPVR